MSIQSIAFLAALAASTPPPADTGDESLANVVVAEEAIEEAPTCTQEALVVALPRMQGHQLVSLAQSRDTANVLEITIEESFLVETSTTSGKPIQARQTVTHTFDVKMLSTVSIQPGKWEGTVQVEMPDGSEGGYSGKRPVSITNLHILVEMIHPDQFSLVEISTQDGGHKTMLALVPKPKGNPVIDEPKPTSRVGIPWGDEGTAWSVPNTNLPQAEKSLTSVDGAFVFANPGADAAELLDGKLRCIKKTLHTVLPSQ